MYWQKAFSAAMVAVAALFSGLAQASVVSTFDTDKEGWSVFGDSAAAAQWSATVGNPPGSAYCWDSVSGGTWGFVAPAKFLGDQSGAYGQELSYDLMINARDTTPWTWPYVKLTGAGLEFRWYGDFFPTINIWNHFQVTLSPADNWVKGTTSVAPTEAEWNTLLSSLSGLWIRAEYRTGSDSAWLDNVVLNTQDTSTIPEPVSLAIWIVLGAIGICITWWRRRS